jgi:hypothetical protein
VAFQNYPQSQSLSGPESLELDVEGRYERAYSRSHYFFSFCFLVDGLVLVVLGGDQKDVKKATH